jgi:hypothetical protein
MKQALTTIGELVGGVLIAIGFGLILPALGWIVAGALLIGVCFLVSL